MGERILYLKGTFKGETNTALPFDFQIFRDQTLTSGGQNVPVTVFINIAYDNHPSEHGLSLETL